MKNFNVIALSVLALAVVGLYVLHFTSKAREAEPVSTEEMVPPAIDVDSLTVQISVGAEAFNIAYVDVAKMQESLQKLDFFKKMNEKLLQKEAKSRKDFQSAQQKYGAELEVFQQKYQAGGFLTKESLEQEQMRLYKREQELQGLQMRLEQEMANEQIKLSKQLMDTIDVFFKSYSSDKTYKLILNRADVLFADETMDITPDVLEKLNARYTKTNASGNKK